MDGLDHRGEVSSPYTLPWPCLGLLGPLWTPALPLAPESPHLTALVPFPRGHVRYVPTIPKSMPCRSCDLPLAPAVGATVPLMPLQGPMLFVLHGKSSNATHPCMTYMLGP